VASKPSLIKNPLTIVGAFASIAEVSGTVVLLEVDPAIRSTFVWFVIGLPLALVALFFVVLWFKPENLYAPGDYRNDESFLQSLFGVGRGALATTKPNELAPERHLAIAPTTRQDKQVSESLGAVAVGSTVAVVDVAGDATKLFTLRGLNLSDVSNAGANAIFMFGSAFGFALLDGAPGIVFFGAFHELEVREAKARLICLLKNINGAYSRTDAIPDEAARAASLSVLDRISVEVVLKSREIAEETVKAVGAEIPKRRKFEVLAQTPGELHAALDSWYTRLGI
jgi:hypothetical protein